MARTAYGKCSFEKYFVVLAITVLVVFTLLPILLLCLYPCRCFQQLLNSCHMRSQALHKFMVAFQGCYKDGTNGTRDCRYFAAIYLITQIAVHLSLVYSSVSFTNSVLITSLAIVALILSVFHPHKKRFYNQLDVFFVLLTMVFISSMWVLQGSVTFLAWPISLSIQTGLYFGHLDQFPLSIRHVLFCTTSGRSQGDFRESLNGSEPFYQNLNRTK